MITLTADNTVLLKDVGLFYEPVEIYDTHGKLLGLFVPANLERGKELSRRVSTEIDWSEIERLQQSDEKRYRHEDVEARLHALEKELARRKAAGEPDWSEDDALAFLDRLREN